MLSDFGIKGCVFDFDGTIVLTEHVHLKAWEDLAAELGLTFPKGYLEASVGRSDPEVVAELVKLWGHRYSADELHMRKRKFYLGRSKLDYEVVPGVLPFLAAISAQVPMALATNSSIISAAPFLDELDLRKYFVSINTRETVKAPKPHPDIYLKACETLGLAPSDCIAFEDSVTGCAAVRAAGLRLVAIESFFTRDRLGPYWRAVKDFTATELQDLIQ